MRNLAGSLVSTIGLAVLLGGCSTAVDNPRSESDNPATMSSPATPSASASASASPSASAASTDPDTQAWWDAVVQPTKVPADRPANPAAFAEARQALEHRVHSPGLAGGVLRVVRDGQVIHESTVGGFHGGTPLPMASATKWFTSAVIMSLVEEGAIDLDAPISTYLAVAREPGAVTAEVKVRNLLTHTSGVRDVACMRDGWGSTTDCARTLVRTPLEFPSGSAVAYGNGPWHLAGILISEVTGVPFEELFRQRVGGPLGLTGSTWGGGPNPAAGGGLVTTVDDYSRFLDMILGGGTTRDGVKVLSKKSVAEMVSNQLEGHDHWIDNAATVTGIHEYGLGLWRDTVDEQGRAVVISGNASLGYYPWVDFPSGAYGVLAVSDQRGPEFTVPESQRVVKKAIEATAAY